jgi:hypothetical protein
MLFLPRTGLTNPKKWRHLIGSLKKQKNTKHKTKQNKNMSSSSSSSSPNASAKTSDMNSTEITLFYPIYEVSELMEVTFDKKKMDILHNKLLLNRSRNQNWTNYNGFLNLLMGGMQLDEKDAMEFFCLRKILSETDYEFVPEIESNTMKSIRIIPDIVVPGMDKFDVSKQHYDELHEDFLKKHKKDPHYVVIQKFNKAFLNATTEEGASDDEMLILCFYRELLFQDDSFIEEEPEVASISGRPVRKKDQPIRFKKDDEESPEHNKPKTKKQKKADE